ncbi:hypothetical protein [Dolichospermum circinale]|uniref:hypothetical protein n=1 Tax=Dolichospermum circinale TaxID=109265 RepID=UPI00232B5841|nr:hypothetical protein [Dolichospermum circinale]MDB9449788.1 hypothetical protein [Dolichospermum circinale CS-547]
MPHAYNRAAFTTGADSSNCLLSLYCSLVALELAIKDHYNPPWKSRHRIITWVGDLGEASLAQQLKSQLAALQCTDVNGDHSPVDGDNYPGIRYIRHEGDFPGTSTDTQIRDALETIKDIKTSLRTKGVSL